MQVSAHLVPSTVDATQMEPGQHISPLAQKPPAIVQATEQNCGGEQTFAVPLASVAQHPDAHWVLLKQVTAQWPTSGIRVSDMHTAPLQHPFGALLQSAPAMRQLEPASVPASSPG